MDMYRCTPRCEFKGRLTCGFRCRFMCGFLKRVGGMNAVMRQTMPGAEFSMLNLYVLLT